MGVVFNVCKKTTPQMKAKAERMAVLRSEALIGILQAGTELDRMGLYFWEGDFEEAKKPLKKAFQEFRLSHKKLIELQHAEFEMHPEKNKAYINTETDLPLYKDQQLKEMFQERVRGVQHLIQSIEHLLTTDCEQKTLNALENQDIKEIYNCVSIPVREIVEVATEHNAQIVKQSRLTHELTDVTNLLIPDTIKLAN